MPNKPTDALLELRTIKECGMFVISIQGGGVDLCAQGSTREQALERIAMQGAMELIRASQGAE